MDIAAFDLAAQQIGMDENDQNAALTEYLNNGGQRLDPAVTAWCAAFVNATLAQTGGQGTNALNARSYLDWGVDVGDDPQRGDIVVFSRGDPNGWEGHVGFFDGYNDDGTIRVLGGNQSDGVNISNYGADRLLGFRRAEGGTTPEAAAVMASNPTQSPRMPQQAPQEPERNALAMPQLNYAVNALDPQAFATSVNGLVDPLRHFRGV